MFSSPRPELHQLDSRPYRTVGPSFPNDLHPFAYWLYVIPIPFMAARFVAGALDTGTPNVQRGFSCTRLYLHGPSKEGFILCLLRPRNSGSQPATCVLVDVSKVVIICHFTTDLRISTSQHWVKDPCSRSLILTTERCSSRCNLGISSPQAVLTENHLKFNSYGDHPRLITWKGLQCPSWALYCHAEWLSKRAFATFSIKNWGVSLRQKAYCCTKHSVFHSTGVVWCENLCSRRQ